MIKSEEYNRDIEILKDNRVLTQTSISSCLKSLYAFVCNTGCIY